METNTMDDNFWDESEYNFYMSLDNTDKLLYIYDLTLGEFAGIDLSHTNIEFIDDESDNIRQSVFASINQTTEFSKITISGDDITTLNNVVNNMMMGGMILSEKTISNIENGGWSLEYKIIGNTPPISVN